MNHTDIELILLEYETITRLKQDKNAKKELWAYTFLINNIFQTLDYNLCPRDKKFCP